MVGPRYLVHSINKLGTSTSVILWGSQCGFSIPLLCVKLRSCYRYLYFNGYGQDFIPKWSILMAENWRYRGDIRGWVVLNSSLFTRNFSFSSSRTKFLPLAFHLLVRRINSAFFDTWCTLCWEFALISIRTALMVLNINIWVCTFFHLYQTGKGW